MSMLRRWPGLVLAVCAGIALTVALAHVRPLAARAVSPALVETIVRDGAPPVVGPADADVTLIVFSDYRCGPCRRSHPALLRAVAADGRVRIVAKEWPVFGPRSHAAARVALAAGEQGRYAAVSDALMRERRPLDEAVLRDVVVRAGGDWPRLQHDLRRLDSTIEDRLATNAVQAQALAIPGTPAYLSGRWLFVGALDEAGFRRLIAKARAG
jgi:protein-disulfide isomerase